MTSSDINDLSLQLGLDDLMGNTPIWENTAVPEDQAYDEFVFDLTPSHFETPATVNVADLIVGSHSMAATTSVSPLELTMANSSAYDQDLALANLYGFNEPSTGSDSDSGSESEESDDAEDSDEDEDGDSCIEMAKVVREVGTASTAAKVIPKDVKPVSVVQPQIDLDATAAAIAPVSTPEDPNKRRMEEALAARISNDLGPEHMAGLFKLLKGTTDEQNEDEDDEEVEVDLSCLDETVLVQVYQYVEACCMQTMGSILAAEKRERAVRAAAVAAAAEADLLRRAHQRMPELLPSHSYASSSSSPQPATPSKTGRRSSGGGGSHKKRHGNSAQESAATIYLRHQETDAVEQAAQNTAWSSGHPYKARWKRAGAVAGGVGGRKTHKDGQTHVPHHPSQRIHQDQVSTGVMDHSLSGAAVEAVVLRAAGQNVDEMECGEDAEIDVVGI